MTLWMIKPQSLNLQLYDRQKKFNTALSSARVTVERRFGFLKCWWKCLLKFINNELQNVRNIIITCFVLQDICQIKHKNYIDKSQVLRHVTEHERWVHQTRIRSNLICDDHESLTEILAEFVNKNQYKLPPVKLFIHRISTPVSLNLQLYRNHSIDLSFKSLEWLLCNRLQLRIIWVKNMFQTLT